MTAHQDCKAIRELDLDPVKVKLMHRQSGEGWSLEQANQTEREYRRFLLLVKLYPEESAAPLADVDTFWHYHILDTMKYAADCQAMFGYFLHHFPYLGLRAEADDLDLHHAAGERMRQLYEQTFAEPYPHTAPASSAFSVVVPATAAGAGASAFSVVVPAAAAGSRASAFSVVVPAAAAGSRDSAFSVVVPGSHVAALLTAKMPAGQTIDSAQQARFYQGRPGLPAQ